MDYPDVEGSASPVLRDSREADDILDNVSNPSSSTRSSATPQEQVTTPDTTPDPDPDDPDSDDPGSEDPDPDAASRPYNLPKGEQVIRSKSTLFGPLVVTFDTLEEKVRGKSNRRPKKFYRSYTEQSATLCYYVPPECHKSHPEVPGLKLEDGNAFQAMVQPKLHDDITPERFGRSFKTTTHKGPGCYISFSESLAEVSKGIGRQYHKSNKVPRRIGVVEVDATNFVPATLRSGIRTVEDKWDMVQVKHLPHTTTERNVKIPFWIAATPGLTDIGNILMEDIERSGIVYWFSVPELMVSDLRLPASVRHQKEWLAAGRIPISSIVNNWPFDGNTIHYQKGYEMVRSVKSSETFLFNWTKSMYLHNPDTSIVTDYRLEHTGEKRKRVFTERLDRKLARKREDALRRFDEGQAAAPEDEIEVIIAVEAEGGIQVDDDDDVAVDDVIDLEDEMEMGIEDELDFDDLDVGDDSEVEEEQSAIEQDELVMEEV